MCHTCSSTQSFEDCDSKLKDDITCDGDKQCGKASYRYGANNVFAKLCIATKRCDDTEFCKSLSGTKDCKVTCCDKDLCNTGPSIMVSSVLALCSFVAVMLMKH